MFETRKNTAEDWQWTRTGLFSGKTLLDGRLTGSDRTSYRLSLVVEDKIGKGSVVRRADMREEKGEF